MLKANIKDGYDYVTTIINAFTKVETKPEVILVDNVSSHHVQSA